LHTEQRVSEANGLWYTSAYPESAWIKDWKTMVSRYSSFKDASGNPTVIAVDLRNEPYLVANGSHTGSCWTGDSSTGGCPTSNAKQNWPAAAQRAGNAVLAVNSKLLVMVKELIAMAETATGGAEIWKAFRVTRSPCVANRFSLLRARLRSESISAKLVQQQYHVPQRFSGVE
jgi:hypothetical protein